MRNVGRGVRSAAAELTTRIVVDMTMWNGFERNIRFTLAWLFWNFDRLSAALRAALERLLSSFTTSFRVSDDLACKKYFRPELYPSGCVAMLNVISFLSMRFDFIFVIEAWSTWDRVCFSVRESPVYFMDASSSSTSVTARISAIGIKSMTISSCMGAK